MPPLCWSLSFFSFDGSGQHVRSHLGYTKATCHSSKKISWLGAEVTDRQLSCWIWRQKWMLISVCFLLGRRKRMLRYSFSCFSQINERKRQHAIANNSLCSITPGLASESSKWSHWLENESWKFKSRTEYCPRIVQVFEWMLENKFI